MGRELKEREFDRTEQFRTSTKTVLGHLAMWAVRLSPYTYPDDLPVVLTMLSGVIGAHVACLTLPKEEWDLFVAFGWFHTTEAHLEELLTILFTVPEFRKWNNRRNGNPAPLGIVSAYDDPSRRDPDDAFVDIYALVGNVARTVHVEETRGRA